MQPKNSQILVDVFDVTLNAGNFVLPLDFASLFDGMRLALRAASSGNLPIKTQDGISLGSVSLNARVKEFRLSGNALDYISYSDSGTTSFLQSGNGAVTTTIQDELRNALTLKQFGAVCDGVTDDTAAVQAAIIEASASGRPILVNGFAKINGDIAIPATGFHLFGRHRYIDGFILAPQSASITGGTHAYFLADSATNTKDISFHALGFKSTYNSSTWNGSMVFPVYQSAPNNGVTHSNIWFEDCLFFDMSFNGVYIAPHVGGMVRNILIENCDADVTSLQYSSRFANLYQGIIEWIAYPGHGTTYGMKQIINARIINCNARGIRTLADMKRGHSKFLISNCFTEDMSDCHYSVDGSFSGKLSNVIGSQTSSLLPNKNFIEIQGEDIDVVDYEYRGTLGLGSVAGVLLTHYAYPTEDAKAYHQCRRVNLLNGRVNGINQNAVRLQDPVDCTVDGLDVMNSTQSGVSIENPSTTENGGINLAFPIGTKINNLRGGPGAGVYGVNLSPKAVRTKIGDVGGFLGKVTGSFNYDPIYRDNLNPNPALSVSGGALTGFGLSSGVSVANSATAPVGTSQSLQVSVTAPGSVATVALSDFVKVIPTSALADGTVLLGDVISVRCSVQLGTATVAGVLFQEFDASGNFISSEFQGLPGLSNSAFKENIIYHMATASNCAFVRVALLPTSDSNATSAGTSFWSNIVVTKRTA